MESISLCKCRVCGHRWFPRMLKGKIRLPARCPNPKCQTKDWRKKQ